MLTRMLGGLWPLVLFAPDDPANGGGTGEPPKDPPPAAKTFTQEELDRIVGERLARAERKPPEDYEALKAKAAKLDELEAANATDLEKAQKAAEDAARERDEAKAAAAKATETVTATLMRAAIVAEAAKQGAVDPGDVHDLLQLPAQKGLREKVTLGDDGQVTGAEEAVKGLLEAKQHLVGNAPTGPGGGGPRQPAPKGDLDQQIKDAQDKGDWATAGQLKAQKLAQQQAAAS